MRDYSKPFYDISELTAAFNGVCKRLGKEQYCSDSSMPLLGQQIAKLAQTEGIHIDPTGDVGTAGINLQYLIGSLIKKGATSHNHLRLFIDAELANLPKHPLINYFDDRDN